MPVVQSLSVPQQPSGVTFTSRSKRPRQQAAGLTEDKQQGPASCGDSNNNGTQVLKLEAIAMPQRLSRVSAAAVAAETNVSGAATAPQQPSGVTFTSRSKRSRPQAAVLTESEQQGPAEPRGDSNSKDGTQILKLKAIPWPQHFSRVPAAAVAAETNVSGAATDKTQATLSAQPCQTHSKPPNAAVLTHSRIAAQQAMVVPVARMACQAAVMPQVTAVSSLTASIAPSVKAAVCGPSAYARPVATSAVSSHPVCSLSEALRVVNAKLAGKDAILPEQLQAYVDIHDSLGLDEADLKKNLMDVGKLTLNQALYMKVCVMEAKRNVT